MTPEYFLERLIDRAWSRYRVQVTKSKLEDWIAEYLVPRAVAGGTHHWQRDRIAYRRALEVCRIESRAPEGRRLLAREIRIQQWLSGRSFPEVVTREDIAKEFARSKNELLRSLRSSLGGNTNKPLSEKRLETIARQMGKAEPKILPAGFQYQNPELVEVLSWVLFSQSDEVKLGEINISPQSAISAIYDRWNLSPIINSFFPKFAESVCSTLAGFWGDPAQIEGAVEEIIKCAEFEQHEIARDVSREMPWVMNHFVEIISSLSPQHKVQVAPMAGPCREIAIALKTQQWRFAIFVVMLVAVHREEDKGKLIAYLVKGILPTVRKLISHCRTDQEINKYLNNVNPWDFLVLLTREKCDLTPELIRVRFRLMRRTWRFGLADLRRQYRKLSKARASVVRNAD